MSYLNIRALTEAAADGKAIEILSEAFDAEARALRQEILAIEAPRPWGSDHFGEEFRRTYMDAEEGEEPARDTVLNALNRGGARMSHIGRLAYTATQEVALGQAENAASFRAVDTDV